MIASYTSSSQYCFEFTFLWLLRDTHHVQIHPLYASLYIHTPQRRSAATSHLDPIYFALRWFLPACSVGRNPVTHMVRPAIGLRRSLYRLRSPSSATPARALELAIHCPRRDSPIPSDATLLGKASSVKVIPLLLIAIASPALKHSFRALRASVCAPLLSLVVDRSNAAPVPWLRRRRQHRVTKVVRAVRAPASAGELGARRRAAI